MWLPILCFRLLLAHAVCDFVLQSDTMAKGKNRNNAPPVLPPGQKVCACWPYWLTAHALVAGAGVWWATELMAFGVFEFMFHWVIDFAKCEGMTDPHVDQSLHMWCRVLYLIGLYLTGATFL